LAPTSRTIVVAFATNGAIARAVIHIADRIRIWAICLSIAGRKINRCPRNAVGTIPYGRSIVDLVTDSVGEIILGTSAYGHEKRGNKNTINRPTHHTASCWERGRLKLKPGRAAKLISDDPVLNKSKLRVKSL